MNAIVKVPFDGGDIECARDDSGNVWVVLAPICARIGDIKVDGQVQKLKEIPHMARVQKIWTLRADGREVEQWAVNLDGMAAWLMSISLKRVSREVRPHLERLQADGARVLRNHFFPAAATPKPPAVADPDKPRVLSDHEVKAGMAAIELALDSGAIDKGDAAVRYARLIQGKIDLFAVPEGLSFQRALPPVASQALADGRRVIISVEPDETGFQRASAIGKRHGLSGEAVNDIAKELGVHGEARFGEWRDVTAGTRVVSRYFVYNAEGVAAIEPKVAEAGAAKRAVIEAKARRAARQPGLPLP